MNYKVVIVDDEEDARELLKIHLAKLQGLELAGEASNGKEALELIEAIKPDIALLDIQMPELNGLELVQQLKYLPQFIFITAYNEFAVKAFELNAVDYLLKPFTFERFEMALNRAKGQLQQGQVDTSLYKQLLSEIQSLQNEPNTYIKRIAYKAGQTTHYIDTDQIILIESADQYVNIQTKGKKFLLRQSMDYLENRLDPKHFFRTHRSYIVRLEAVTGIEQIAARNIWVYLKHGHKAKLSQIRKQLFLGKLEVG